MDGKDRGGWEWPDFLRDPWATADSPILWRGARRRWPWEPLLIDTRPQVGQQLNELGRILTTLDSSAHRRFDTAVGRLKAASCSPPLKDTISSSMRSFRSSNPRRGMDHGIFGAVATPQRSPPYGGSDTYATAYVAFILQQGGVGPSDGRLARALEWLRASGSPIWFLGSGFDEPAVRAGFIADWFHAGRSDRVCRSWHCSANNV